MTIKVTWKPNRGTIARVKKGLYDRLKPAGSVALSIAAERVGVSAMSKDELARRGHPYAQRGGGFGSLPTPQSKAPSEYVGSDTGKLARSLYGSQRGFYYLIEFKGSPSYARFVFNGTRVMLARQPLAVLQSSEGAQKKILDGFAKGGKV